MLYCLLLSYLLNITGSFVGGDGVICRTSLAAYGSIVVEKMNHFLMVVQNRNI